MKQQGKNIYVAVVEALRKKERQDETQIPTKISGKTSLGPIYLVCIILVTPLMSYCAKTSCSRPLIA